MKKKKDDLFSRLRALPRDEAYQAKVDVAKAGLSRLAVADLAKSLDRTVRSKRLLEDKVYALNVKIEALNQLVLRWFDEHDADQIRTRSGILFYRKLDAYSQVRSQGDLFAWIKQNHAVFLLGVNWQRLNSFVRDRLAEGKNPPPGVDVFLKTSVVRRGRIDKKGEER